MTRKPFCSIAGTSSAIVRRNIETKKMNELYKTMKPLLEKVAERDVILANKKEYEAMQNDKDRYESSNFSVLHTY